MAATLTSILVHVTFSTKHRQKLIPADLNPELFQYIGGVCRDLKSPLLHAGGTDDHVHLLVSLGKTESISDLMLHVKRASSVWIKNARPGLATFAWQDGYWARSCDPDVPPALPPDGSYAGGDAMCDRCGVAHGTCTDLPPQKR